MKDVTNYDLPICKFDKSFLKLIGWNMKDKYNQEGVIGGFLSVWFLLFTPKGWIECKVYECPNCGRKYTDE